MEIACRNASRIVSYSKRMIVTGHVIYVDPCKSLRKGWRVARFLTTGFTKGDESNSLETDDSISKCTEDLGPNINGKIVQSNFNKAFYGAASIVKQQEENESKVDLNSSGTDSQSVIDLTSASMIKASDFHRLPPKCTGCGSIFQSLNPDLPGYLVKEKLEKLKEDYNETSFASVTGQKSIICKPCYDLRHRNQVSRRPQDKNSVLSQLNHLKKTRALILYVVDLFDMYGTLVPDLSSIIGSRKHIIIVGNKIDKFPSGTYTTGGKQTNALKEALVEAVKKFTQPYPNVVDICLISAAHGYGIEDLIVKINKHRETRSHVYIVGGNNSGKSTLFNMLQNLINVLSRNKPLPPQAIVHNTPGSTFSLLRHPIGKSSLKAVRKLFLIPPEEKKEESEEEILSTLSLADDLVAELGLRKDPLVPNNLKNNIQEKPKESRLVKKQVEVVEDTENEPRGLFLYDTPGIPNSEQLLQFLTPGEIHLLKQTLWIVPDTRILKPGQVLLIGGLVRIDYIEISRPSKDDISCFEEVPKASQSVFFTTFFPRNLPRHISNDERVDGVYKRNLGEDLLKIPFGDSERLKAFPELKPLEYTIVGCGWDQSAKDIVFNGLGWISVTAGYLSQVKLKVYTPLGVGQYAREKPLMPGAIKKRGRRGGQYLGRKNKQIYQSTRKGNPALTDYLDQRNETTKALMEKISAKKKYDKYCIANARQQLRLEQGVVLGAFKRIGKLEKLLEENARKAIQADHTS